MRVRRPADAKALADSALARRALAAPPDFDFRATVRSHGWWMLAPFRWQEGTDVLSRPLRAGRVRIREIRLSQPGGRGSEVAVEVRGGPRAETAWRAIESSVRRMLQLDFDPHPFHERCLSSGPPFDRVVELGFGRLLRSPTLFEDVVKVMATTNTSWSGTRSMIARLVRAAGDGGDFPGPARLARIGAERAARDAGWGYRAPYLAAFAEGVAGDEIDLAGWERWAGSTADLEGEIRAVPGLGPYAAAEVLALLGRFDRIGVDSVFRSFVRRRHFPRARRPPKDRRLLAVYRRWGEWQALAYWFDVWYGDYEGGEMLESPRGPMSESK